MRQLAKNVLNPTVLTTDTWLLGPNLKRRAVIISAPTTNRITLSFGGGAAVLDSGIGLNPGTQALKLDEDTIGDAIVEEMRGISAVAAQTIGIIEIFDAQ